MQEPEVEVKPCRKCGARDRDKTGACRPCAQERSRRYYKENKEKVLRQRRRYYDSNRKRMIEQKRRYRRANPEKARQYRRSYYEVNREKAREYARSYREKNPEKALEGERRYRNENPERTLEQWRRYAHSRRARKSNPNYPNDKLSRGLKKKLMKLQGGKCTYANAPLAYWCAVDITKENHMDHIMPLALDGRNIDSNMQLTCPACNLRKSDSHPDDFARRVGLIV